MFQSRGCKPLPAGHFQTPTGSPVGEGNLAVRVCSRECLDSICSSPVMVKSAQECHDILWCNGKYFLNSFPGTPENPLNKGVPGQPWGPLVPQSMPFLTLTVRGEQWELLVSTSDRKVKCLTQITLRLCPAQLSLLTGCSPPPNKPSFYLFTL